MSDGMKNVSQEWQNKRRADKAEIRDALLSEGLFVDVPEKDRLFIHALTARNKGWCIQCQFPWYDGICDCGHFSGPEVEKALTMYHERQTEKKEKAMSKEKGVPVVKNEGKPIEVQAKSPEELKALGDNPPSVGTLKVTDKTKVLLSEMTETLKAGGAKVWPDQKVVGHLAKPEPLFMLVEPMVKGHGWFNIWVGGSLAKDNIRFSDKSGAAILKQGDETSWKPSGKTGGTLTVMAWLPRTSKGSAEFDTVDRTDWPKPMKQHGEAVSNIRKAVEAYNEWCRKCPGSRTGSEVEGEGLFDEMLREQEKAKEKKVSSKTLLDEVDVLVTKLLADVDSLDEQARIKIADTLENLAVEIRIAAARRAAVYGFAKALMVGLKAEAAEGHDEVAAETSDIGVEV